MNYHPAFITVTQGISGYFAVMMNWNPNYGGFYEPYTTGIGRHDKYEYAINEAKLWATAEGLEYRP